MLQRPAHKRGTRRDPDRVSPPNRVSELIRSWLRLWLPLLVIAFAFWAAASIAFADSAGCRVTATADVRPTFKLTIDDTLLSVSSNVPWVVTLWNGGSRSVYDGGPTSFTRLGATPTAGNVTVVVDAPITPLVVPGQR